MIKTVVQPIKDDFEEVFKEQFPIVYGYIYYHINNTNDAEDLTADVFTRAFRYWYSYSPERGSRGEWIGGIARNTVKTYAQKKVYSFQTIELSEFIPANTDVEAVCLRNDDIRRVFAQIATLPEWQRKLLIMKFFWNCSNKDIAKVMSMSASNVGVTLHRIIKKLQTSLQKYIS
ncbi:MAG: sigma-70 family RNA polymerase sigma factor [Prevotellaceae bacterium]|jgi:RNA polymerase sigma-70 factor (ECF subfamily)|nr:sigma-70 family RNA polymerase sigma factor [Prevotellaceae bacterium]